MRHLAFLALALAANPALCATLIIWLFAMRILMVITSLLSYWINDAVSRAVWGQSKDFNLEQPLTNLVWISSLVSIAITYLASYFLLSDLGGGLWWVLSTIISLGTLAGALIPEFTKVFTSTESRHVKEVVTASAQGGASLNILSGFVAGNFSAFWKGLVIAGLMLGVPLLAQALTQAPPGLAGWCIAVGTMGLVLTLDATYKAMRRRSRRSGRA